MSLWRSQDRSYPLIIGHRGASAEAPENTMAGFRLALEQGAAGFEFDVHLARDGQPIIIHDHLLQRTTNGQGPVSTMSVEQLKQLDAGGGETIPTLEELFAEFGHDALYNIELKGFYFGGDEFQQAVAALVERYQLAEHVVVSSFSFLNMHRYRKVAANGTLMGMIRYPSPQALSHYLFRGNVDHPHFSMVDEAYMAWANEHNIRVHVWTVNEADEARRLRDLGVHGLITDRPGGLIEELT